MPSLVSQMRNGTIPQQPQPQQSQAAQYNQSIEAARRMMQMVQASQNPQAALAQMLQNNPNTAAISSMLKNGGSLESIARQMAATKGIDINQLINQLGGT